MSSLSVIIRTVGTKLDVQREYLAAFLPFHGYIDLMNDTKPNEFALVVWSF